MSGPEAWNVVGMNDDELLRTLANVERRGWDALCDTSAARFYGDVMTENGLMVLANGMVMDRGQVVDALAQAPPWHTYALEELRLVRLGEDTAALVYSASAHRQPGDEPFRAAMTSVYVREHDRWRLALYQQTPIPSA